ncbi:MAG TPA: LysE family translocator [Microbacteriaceae bacterium]|nr:LysE family translocator [Microbacteriaceae bacterium]
MLVDLAPLAGFVPAALVVTTTPGADTMLTIRNTARWGRRGGVLTILGILTGVSLMSVLVVSGVGVLLTRTPFAMEALKIGGALYLLWLAIQSVMAVIRIHRGADGGWSPVEGDIQTVARKNWRERFGPFLTGLFTNVTNPKVLVFLFAFFPQFLGTAESTTLQLVMLAVIWIGLAIGWLGLIVATVQQSSRIVQSPRFSLVMEYVSAAVFVALAVVLVLPTHA